MKHHCNFCLKKLCSSCIPKHMSEKKNTRWLSLTAPKERPTLLACHIKYRFEMFCRFQWTSMCICICKWKKLQTNQLFGACVVRKASSQQVCSEPKISSTFYFWNVLYCGINIWEPLLKYNHYFISGWGCILLWGSLCNHYWTNYFLA